MPRLGRRRARRRHRGHCALSDEPDVHRDLQIPHRPEGGQSHRLRPIRMPCAARFHAARLMAEAAEAAGCPKGATSLPDDVEVRRRAGAAARPAGASHPPRGRRGHGPCVIQPQVAHLPRRLGNGPAYIHRSADIPRAVRDILRSKTFDNGTVCASEQSYIVERLARVREEFRKPGLLFPEHGGGRRAAAAPPGRHDQSEGRRQDGLRRGVHGGRDRRSPRPCCWQTRRRPGPARPYSREKLCPILGVFRRGGRGTPSSAASGVGGRGAGHTFVLHAKDEAVVRRFALTVPVSRFLVNVPARRIGAGDGPVPRAHARLRRGGRQLVVQ